MDGEDKTTILDTPRDWVDEQYSRALEGVDYERAECYGLVLKHVDQVITTFVTVGTPPRQLGALGTVTLEEIERARAIYASGMDGDVEVDDDAIVDRGEDGMWVSAWVWLKKENSDDAD